MWSFQNIGKLALPKLWSFVSVEMDITQIDLASSAFVQAHTHLWKIDDSKK